RLRLPRQSPLAPHGQSTELRTQSPSVDPDVRGFDHRPPPVDLAIDPRPEFGWTAANSFNQLCRTLFANRRCPNGFYHLAMNLRNDGLRRMAGRDHAHPGV